MDLEISPFPSGAALHLYGGSALAILLNIPDYLGLPIGWLEHGWAYKMMVLLFMLIIGVILYNWFWGGIDLFGTEVENLPGAFRDNEKLLDGQFYRSMVVLLGGTALFWVPFGPAQVKSPDLIISFMDLLLGIVIIRDLWTRRQFWKKHGAGVSIMEIDNVHLASYLKGLLEAEKIPCYFQAFEYRKLMMWLSPLYKIQLFVDEADEQKAKEMVGRVHYRVV